MSTRPVWLDCDPGHDDATAILLALHCSNIRLLGISTGLLLVKVHGNAPPKCTEINAARCLYAFGGPSTNVRIYPGVEKPLIVPARHDPEIHGPDGLGGVEGFPPTDSPDLLPLYATDAEGNKISALEGLASAVRKTWKNGKGEKVVVVSTGPMTNIALFVAAHAELLEGVEEFVFMGGGVGLGNRSSVAEYNIMVDPHASQIVIDAPVKKTMIPLNVTHTAIFTNAVHTQLLSPGAYAGDTLPPPATNLRHTLSTLMTYFADAYKATFAFNDGPPLHDALTIGYVSNPSLFKTVRKRVDIELTGIHTVGETVVDIWDYQRCHENTWGPGSKNCLVAEKLDVDGFFDLLLTCITRSDKVSPLNAN